MLGVNSLPLDILKLGFWNINGCNSKVIGNKLITRDFRETIKSCNVIGLAETHVHSATLDKLSIPGYKRTHFMNREPHSKGCGSGGIALFCDESISNHFTPIPNSNKDVIWVKIDKNLCGEDVYLGTIYLSPSGKKENIIKIFQTLGDEIALFQRKGKGHWS